MPATPGAATYDNVTFLRAYRQPAGGAATVAGVSANTAVSVVGISPLTPGVSYQVWVVGVNSRGEGPVGNKITFTA